MNNFLKRRGQTSFLSYRKFTESLKYLICVVFVGHYAIRNQKHGSYMLKHFSESVDACYTKYGSADLMDILKDVTYKMSELEVCGSNEYKIVPSIVHKLNKDVIFTHGRK